jgi:hypothetical protein
MVSDVEWSQSCDITFKQRFERSYDTPQKQTDFLILTGERFPRDSSVDSVESLTVRVLFIYIFETENEKSYF